MFATFEGGEGVGKSTQIRLLAASLRDEGREVVVTREPGGTPFAEMIRAHVLSGAAAPRGAAHEARLFAIARREHVGRLVRPALDRGAVVLCDRFVDSTRALQGASGVDEALIDELERRAAGDCMPDLTILLELDDRQTERRRMDRGVDDRFEREGGAFHAEVRRRFRRCADRWPERIRRVDASGAPDEVARRVLETFQSVSLQVSRCSEDDAAPIIAPRS